MTNYPLAKFFSFCIGKCHGEGNGRLANCNSVFYFISLVLYCIIWFILLLVLIPILFLLFTVLIIVYIGTCGFCFDPEPCRLLECLSLNLQHDIINIPISCWECIAMQCCCCFQYPGDYEYDYII